MSMEEQRARQEEEVTKPTGGTVSAPATAPHVEGTCPQLHSRFCIFTVKTAFPAVMETNISLINIPTLECLITTVKLHNLLYYTV